MQETIEKYYEEAGQINAENVPAELREAVQETLRLLDAGELRVAEKVNSDWVVHEWVKKAIVLSFRVNANVFIENSFGAFYDKTPSKFAEMSAEDFAKAGIRVVPPSHVRYGSFIAKGCVLMPCFVNMGAYIDEACLIDTWASVGSCAQIGKNVHLSGGAGIGGVLEPLQSRPTIIEDNVFIGARSEIVEGVIVEKNSVISMGVFIGQSTKIYHRETGEIFYGRVPEGSVVVPGSLPAKDGSHSLACAVIVKQIDAKTRAKTSINDLLR